MKQPLISAYYQGLQPSPLRGAKQIALKRKDKVVIIDSSIGSVSLPTHPAIQKRMMQLGKFFSKGALPYTATIGTDEAKAAFVNIYQALGVDIGKMQVIITSGGSLAMQYVMLGIGDQNRSLVGFAPLYANYLSYGERFNLPVKSLVRILTAEGRFTMPDEKEIERFIQKEKPSGLLVIPADNPSGAYFNQDKLNYLAKLCVKYNLWLVSDEAYFGLTYMDSGNSSSIWRITEHQVPGIKGRRIGIHSASKNMNACGLRIGALITDNEELAEKAVNCASADLGAGIVDQYLFGALAGESVKSIRSFLTDLRIYYEEMLLGFRKKLLALSPGLIVSQPEASIYQVVDFRKVAPKGFKALDFINWAAKEGKVMIKGKPYIMIGAPMSGFYQPGKGEENPGNTQIRIAFVMNKEEMWLGAEVLAKQFEIYLERLTK
ncbi:MAG: aminotransferase class I/II-fold pyridoxal phosphate-dependent enzyme [Patescibacteria group bacterium]|nr:aminotransferase class I/II-fold pyridoxal phosphate-dependent enzyme [Patescibacteria group bacterium]